MLAEDRACPSRRSAQLGIEASNVRLDSYDPAEPVLVVEDPRQPAYLTFNFPPQTIAECAYFEAAIVRPSLDPAHEV